MDQQAQADLSAVVVGLNELSLELIKVLKGGIQLSDAIQLFEDIKGNADLQAKLLAASSAIKNVPADVKGLDAEGMAALLMVEIPYVSKLLAALKA